MGDALGTAIAGLLNLLDPEMVVLGGQISALGDQLLTPLRDAIRTRALFTSVANTEIAITTLGRTAIALGAATLVLEDALRDPVLFPARAEHAA